MPPGAWPDSFKATPRAAASRAFLGWWSNSVIGKVGHSRQDDVCTSTFHNDMLVFQSAKAERAVMPHLRPMVEEVLMAPRIDVDAVRRMQSRKRFNVVMAVCHAAVDDIASDDDYVHAEPVRCVDHRFRPGPVEQATDVQVGELQQLVAIESRREVGDFERHLLEGRHPDGPG